MAILLVEDDRKLARTIARGLEEQGYMVDTRHTGEAGLERLRAEPVEACVLDVLLPGIDGFEVLTQARQIGVIAPILMLTARDDVPDRVRGLDLGADDYLVKPFAFAELVARLGALIRRGLPQRGSLLACGGLSLDTKTHVVRVDGNEVALSRRQHALLEFLLRHQGEVVPRSMLLEHVFGYKFDPGTNIVDVHIANLRQCIDGAGRPSLIETVRGVGYRIGRRDAD